VYQIDEGRKRLLWIGPERRIKTLLGFFRWFGRDRTARLRFICSDLWKPYLTVVAKKAGHALHILDRFHIAVHLSRAIDDVRRAEVRDLKRQGRQPWLTKARWILLKRPRASDRDGTGTPPGVGPAQSQGRAGDAAARSLRAILGLSLGRLGGGVPR